MDLICPDDTQRETFIELTSWAFGFKLEGTRQWLTERAGVDNLRVLLDEGEVVAGLLVAPMGQFFGGRSVTTWGVAAVGVAPERMGQGLARRLMRGHLRELRRRGVPLSTLYPATVSLYRSVGYGQGGTRTSLVVGTGGLGFAQPEHRIRPMGEGDAERVEALYQARARLENGFMDRAGYLWDRVRRPRSSPARGFIVEGPAGVEGYTFLGNIPTRQLQPPMYKVAIVDMIATNAAAARKLWALVGARRSMAAEATYSGPLGGIEVGVLPELPKARVAGLWTWMIRLADVDLALTARGWSPLVEGELHLDVVDGLLPDNAGPRTLKVGDGKAEVARGGDGKLKIDVRGLASLYTGFRTAEALAGLGLAEGTPETLATATALFALPTPTTLDFF